MSEPKEIGDLLARAVSLKGEAGLKPSSLTVYEYYARNFGAAYEEVAGTTRYDHENVEKTVRHYRDRLDAGDISPGGARYYRRIAADVDDVAEYDAVCGHCLNGPQKPRNPLLRPVSEDVRNDPESVVGLSLAVLAEMERTGYSKHTIAIYRGMALPRLIGFFEKAGSSRYSAETIDAFLDEIEEFGSMDGIDVGILRPAALYMRRMHDEGRLRSQDSCPWMERARQGVFGPVVVEYERWREESGIKASTVKLNLNYIIPFLERICPEGPAGLETVSREEVRAALAGALDDKGPSYAGAAIGPIRLFARFMEEVHPECPAFGQWVGRAPRQPRRRPVEGYTRDHVDAIVDSIDRSTALGKRDAAIVELARSTGMRACDISALAVGDIDWRAKEITIVQSKTGVAVALPLDADAGEAIAEYLLEARGKSDSDKVFLTANAPVGPMSAHAVLSVVRSKGKKVIGDEFGGRHGVHAIRRGLGAQLVEAGVPLPDVADVLGHTDANSTAPYVAISTERLRTCCAGLDKVPVRGKGCDGGRA